eukprot:5703443-Prymnesium_polylepis.1
MTLLYTMCPNYSRNEPYVTSLYANDNIAHTKARDKLASMAKRQERSVLAARRGWMRPTR